MKFAGISDLMFLKVLLLMMWSPDKNINLEILSVPIGIIICHLDSSLVVMLILGLALLELLIIL